MLPRETKFKEKERDPDEIIMEQLHPKNKYTCHCSVERLAVWAKVFDSGVTRKPFERYCECHVQ